MTEEAYQAPVDFTEWVWTLDLSDDETPEQEQEEGAKPYAIGGDADSILGTVYASRPTDEIIEEEFLKEALLKQHHADHYEVEDPSDGMTDDELWESMPKPWRSDG